MKKGFLLLCGALFSVGLMAQSTVLPETGSISGIFTNSGFTWDSSIEYLNGAGDGLAGESGYKGDVADFNADGVDDIIITGLHGQDADDSRLGFLRIYNGVSGSTPVLAYQNDDFGIVGNGDIDVMEQQDGSFYVAVQGGSTGNWANPFNAVIYQVTWDGSSYNLEQMQTLDFGAGRGNIALFDADGDNDPDVFQTGWDEVGVWATQANLYLNDRDEFGDYFLLENYSGATPSANYYTNKADIDNDGDMDFAYVIQGQFGDDAGAYVLWNNGDGTLTEQKVWDITETTLGGGVEGSDDCNQCFLIDIDNDDDLDLVVSATAMVDGPWWFYVKIFRNDDGAFTEIDQLDGQGNATMFNGGQRAEFAVGDFNSDGNQDFILGGENATDGWVCRTFIFYGNGEGGFDEEEITNDIKPMSRRANFGRYLVGDFNADGKDDLVVAGATYYGNDHNVEIFFGSASATGISNSGKLSDVNLYVENNTIIIQDLSAESVAVYNLTGTLIHSQKSTESTVKITLPKTGIYIVKVGSKVEKVLVK